MALWHELKDHHRIDAYRSGNAEIDWRSPQAEGLVLDSFVGVPSGVVDFDLSVNGSDLSHNNGPISRKISHHPRYGAIRCLNFNDASSQYLTTGLPVVTGSPFTFSCWFFPDDVTVNLTMLSIADSAATNHFWRLASQGVAAGDPLEFSCRDGGSVARATTANSVTINTWQHGVGIAVSATDRTAILNGDLANKGTNVTSRIPSGVDNTGVGITISSSLVQDFSGMIADVRIRNIAISEELLQEEYLHPYGLYKPRKRVFYSFATAGGITVTPAAEMSRLTARRTATRLAPRLTASRLTPRRTASRLIET